MSRSFTLCLMLLFSTELINANQNVQNSTEILPEHKKSTPQGDVESVNHSNEKWLRNNSPSDVEFSNESQVKSESANRSAQNAEAAKDFKSVSLTPAARKGNPQSIASPLTVKGTSDVGSDSHGGETEATETKSDVTSTSIVPNTKSVDEAAGKDATSEEAEGGTAAEYVDDSTVTDGPGMIASLSSASDTTDRPTPPRESDIMGAIDEEIKQLLNALPKLPEIVPSDNQSRQFVFRKEPEDVSLDESITQVARQLAETSFKQEFEEKKLGHHIPIRLRHFDERYPYEGRGPRRNAGAGKSINSPFETFPRMSQRTIVTFKPLPIPQHIYRERIYLPIDVSRDTAADPPTNPKPIEEIYKINPKEEGPEVPENNREPLPREIPTFIQVFPRYIFPAASDDFQSNKVPFIFSYAPNKPIPYAFF